MAKVPFSRSKLLGAAVVGAVVYGLSRTQTGKKTRAELEDFLKQLLEKRSVLGSLSKTAYDGALDTAARVYRDSKRLSKRELAELASLAEELKHQWRAPVKKTKRDE